MTDSDLYTKRRDNLLALLASHVEQRPGLDPREYISGPGDSNGRAAYRSDSAKITRDLREARALLAAIRWRDSIGADELIRASERAFSGRLKITPEGPAGFRLDYCTGQYWPMEYRAAACAVIAAALWEYWRENRPAGADGSADSIRAAARREFGRGLASRWFN